MCVTSASKCCSYVYRKATTERTDGGGDMEDTYQEIADTKYACLFITSLPNLNGIGVKTWGSNSHIIDTLGRNIQSRHLRYSICHRMDRSGIAMKENLAYGPVVPTTHQVNR